MSAGPDDDGLPPLREVIARHGLSARKALGQNFLLDLNLTRRIARAAAPLATVVEIGPGPGGLTRALLSEGAERVIAVERDRRCLPALEEIAAHWPGRLEIVEADALAFDPRPMIGAAPASIVANLPYNVGTALLVRWLRGEPADPESWPPWWSSLTLMFQREVAERIVAAPGKKAYGRLSVLARWRAEPRILFDVNPRAFTPPPSVVSSVVRLTPVEPRCACRLSTLERITAAAFSQRRKMLRGSLKGVASDPKALLAAADTPEDRRADAASLADFCALARALDALERG